ncbi:Hypothetical predicted protein, partial [Pelobates cultripes]
TPDQLEIADNNHVNESIRMAVNRNEQGCLPESEPTQDDVSARGRSATGGLTYVFYRTQPLEATTVVRSSCRDFRRPRDRRSEIAGT